MLVCPSIFMQSKPDFFITKIITRPLDFRPKTASAKKSRK